MSTTGTGAVCFPLLILILCFFFSSVITDQSAGDCNPVLQCGDDVVPSVERMSYKLDVVNWRSSNRDICPRSSPSVPQWTIEVQNQSQTISPAHYCSYNVTFNDSSAVCTMETGELLFQNSESSFQNTNGVIEFSFSSINDSYETLFTIRYAATGIYPQVNTVLFEELEKFVTLSWYIYHPDTDPSGVKIYHDNQLISDATIKLDDTKYSTHVDNSFPCMITSFGEDSTYLFNLFVLEPSAAKNVAGEYVLVMDTYSATITLEPNPSSNPSSTKASSTLSPTTLSPSPSLLLTASLSTTDDGFHESSFSSFSPTFAPTSTLIASTANKQPSTILISVLVPLIVLILVLIIVTVITILLVCKHTRHRNSTGSKNRRTKVADIETPADNPPLHPPTLIQQFSQDPSLHKYHMPVGDDGSNSKTTTTAEIELVEQRTDRHTPTPPIPISKSFESMHEKTVHEKKTMKRPTITENRNVSRSMPSSSHLSDLMQERAAAATAVSSLVAISYSQLQTSNEVLRKLRDIKLNEKTKDVEDKEIAIMKSEMLQSISGKIFGNDIGGIKEGIGGGAEKGKEECPTDGCVNELTNDDLYEEDVLQMDYDENSSVESHSNSSCRYQVSKVDLMDTQSYTSTSSAGGDEDPLANTSSSLLVNHKQ